MSRFETTLADFGNRRGISSIYIDQHRTSTFRLSSGETLAVERARRNKIDQVLIYLSQPLRFDAGRLVRLALEKAHFSNGGPYAIQLGVLGEGTAANLVMLISVPERELTPGILIDASDYIRQWFIDLLEES